MQADFLAQFLPPDVLPSDLLQGAATGSPVAWIGMVMTLAVACAASEPDPWHGAVAAALHEVAAAIRSPGGQFLENWWKDAQAALLARQAAERGEDGPPEAPPAAVLQLLPQQAGGPARQRQSA